MKETTTTNQNSMINYDKQKEKEQKTYWFNGNH